MSNIDRKHNVDVLKILTPDRNVLYEFVEDIAKHGLRCDTNPTLVNVNDPVLVAQQMYRYLERLDSRLRRVAARVLEEADSLLERQNAEKQAAAETKDPVI